VLLRTLSEMSWSMFSVFLTGLAGNRILADVLGVDTGLFFVSCLIFGPIAEVLTVSIMQIGSGRSAISCLLAMLLSLLLAGSGAAFLWYAFLRLAYLAPLAIPLLAVGGFHLGLGKPAPRGQQNS